MKKDKLLYAQRDLEELDKAGEFYAAHVQAMTNEDLYSKSDIAAELAYRDAVVNRLLQAINAAASALRQIPTAAPFGEQSNYAARVLNLAEPGPAWLTVGARDGR